MASVGIRRQLGPARKRLTDRIDEVNKIIAENEEDGMLKQVRTSLMSNIDYHGKLTTGLSNVLGTVTDDDERIII